MDYERLIQIWEQATPLDINREKLKLKHEIKEKALDAIRGYVPESIVEEVRNAFNDIILMK